MKHVKGLFFYAIEFALLLLLMLIHVNAEETSALVWYADGDDSVQVDVQTAGSCYLFLPSSADYSSLRLSAPEDTVLSGTNQGESIHLNAGETATVDVTKLFGEMKAGESYNLCVSTSGGNTTILLIKSANLSSMHIRIAGNINDVNQSGDKSVSFPGIYSLINTDGSVFSSGSLDSFKGRGNSSWVRSSGKQPYNIKLSESTELISGSGKSKRWVLVSDNVTNHDLTGLSNKTAMQLYRDLGGEYALDSENVDLYVNEKYLGTYMLSEKVTFSDGVINLSDTVYAYEDTENTTMVVQPMGVLNKPKYWNSVPIKGEGLTVIEREDTAGDSALESGIQAYKYCNDSEIESQGGYLIELDFRFYNEDAWFVTRRGAAIVIREPEHPGLEEVQQIATYVQHFEDALFSQNGFNEQGDYYGDLLNLESQAKMYLLDSFICNRDAHRASTYYYAGLDADGEIGGLYAGPAWDYNSVELSSVHFFGNEIGNYSYNTIWMTQLASHGDFLYLLNELNSESLVPAIEALLNGGFNSYVEQLTPSQEMNGLLWWNKFSYNAEVYADSLAARSDIWNNVLWTEDKLLGLYLTRDGDKLIVKTAGTVNDIVWYKYNENSDAFEQLTGVSGLEYTPTEDGIYSVSATGSNITYNARSATFASDYSPNGIPSFTIYYTVTVFSNPVDTSVPEIVEQNSDETSVSDSEDESNGNEIPQENRESLSAQMESPDMEQKNLTPPENESVEKEYDDTGKRFPIAIVAPVFVIIIGIFVCSAISSAKKKSHRGKHTANK